MFLFSEKYQRKYICSFMQLLGLCTLSTILIEVSRSILGHVLRKGKNDACVVLTVTNWTGGLSLTSAQVQFEATLTSRLPLFLIIIEVLLFA